MLSVQHSLVQELVLAGAIMQLKQESGLIQVGTISSRKITTVLDFSLDSDSSLKELHKAVDSRRLLAVEAGSTV
jgi:hypothetical protein